MRWLERVLPPAWATLSALAFSSLLIWMAGSAPAHVYGLLLEGTWGTAYGLGQVLFKMTPLIFCGLAVSVALRAGLFNTGAEGQIIVGAFAAAWVGAALPPATPAPLALSACVVSAFVGGALVGAMPGWLKAARGAHEVINTIMLNFIVRAAMVGIGLSAFEKETVHTRPIIDAAVMPRVGAFIPTFSGSAFNLSFVLACAVAVTMAWVLFRTRVGFALDTVGASPQAAATAGVSVARTTVWAMALSGGLAGLGGVNFVCGYKHYYEDNFSGGVGFIGIAVAVLGRNHPIGILLTALIFGTLSQGALVINALVPKEIVDVMQAVIIFTVAAAVPEVRRLVQKARAA
jgi:simple sugar transport system permease protein